MDFFCSKDTGLWASASCQAINWIPFVIFVIAMFTWILPALGGGKFLSHGFENYPNLAFRVFLLQQMILLPGVWLFQFAVRLTEMRGNWDEAGDKCSKSKDSLQWNYDLFQVYALFNIAVLLVWSIHGILSAKCQSFWDWPGMGPSQNVPKAAEKKTTGLGTVECTKSITKPSHQKTTVGEKSVRKQINGNSPPTIQDFLVQMRQFLDEDWRRDAELELQQIEDSCSSDDSVDCSPPSWNEVEASTSNEIKTTRPTSTSESFEWVNTADEKHDSVQNTTNLENGGPSSELSANVSPKNPTSEADSIQDAAFAGIGEPYKVLSDEIFRIRRELILKVFACWDLRYQEVRSMTLAEVVRHAMLEGDILINMRLDREEFEDKVIDFLQEYTV
ncbi:MAG: hypothetical protein M1812_006990 [Candelaria pacifica]|nr:MAG: hypothetical protein M1812_006990 [Candelaria pacifica]